MTFFIISILIINLIASLLAWQNTHTIKQDIEKIKVQLNIEEQRSPSVLDHDLDND